MLLDAETHMNMDTWWRNFLKNGHLEYQNEYDRIILRWILSKEAVTMVGGSNCERHALQQTSIFWVLNLHVLRP